MDMLSTEARGSRISTAALSILAVLLSGSVAASGPITEFSLPAVDSFPGRITAGPDGNLWFCEGRNAIGRITPNGSVSEFQTSIPPRDITAGSDGNVWFTEFDFDDVGSWIGRISPSGEVHEFFSSKPACGIAAGPDGNLWFTVCNGRSREIGRITSAGAVTMFPLPTGKGTYPLEIVLGPDGNLWFTQPSARQIGRITTAGSVTEYSVSGNPSSITAGPDGNLWFVDGDKIARITTGGAITEFAISARILGVGPGGNLWFANADRIGRLSIAADRLDIDADVVIPTPNAFVSGITAGPDGNLWFTESDGNKIGRLELSPCSPGSLCLGGRFQVTAAWEGGGSSGTGTPVSLTTNAGYFWFFGASNIEVFVKVLDACAASGKFNVYVNGLTHLGVTVTVTDLETGISKAFVNPGGAPFSLLFDGSTFACP